MIICAIFVAPIKAGSTIRVAPLRSSFFSVDGDSARAMISIVAFSSRALSVMKTLVVSSGRTVAKHPGASDAGRFQRFFVRSGTDQDQKSGCLCRMDAGFVAVDDDELLVCLARSWASICPTRP